MLRSLAEFGILPQDDEDTRLRKKLLVRIGSLASLLIMGIGGVHLVFNERLAGWVYIGYSLFIMLNIGLFGVWHKTDTWAVTIVSSTVLPTHLVLTVLLGGFVNSGGVALWGLFFPALLSLVFYNLRQSLLWFAAFALNLLLSFVLQPWLRPTNNFPPLVAQWVLGINIFSIASLTMGAFAYFVGQRDAAFQLLRGEQAKSEALLLNILPKDIAAILKNESRVIADHFEEASILFADVVNFTPLSTQLTPIELVSLLNEVFSHFDTLVEKHGLEKIKTIGDCYMVASGVPRPRPDHAQALVSMALEMQAFIQSRQFHGRTLEFRIGINSGPVVAGVIGRRKFIYDLWGDAVNTASRMESHGHGGVIQITRATYTLIQNDFVCEPHGTINVKGKGETEVWHVIAQRSAA